MEINAMPQRVKDWFLARTISEQVLSDFNIGWNGTSIVIPVYAPDGNFLFNKYRRDPEKEDGPKYTYDKGGTISLYGAHKLDALDTNRVILVEGELDALCLRSHGYIAVSSTGGAGPFDPRWADLLSGKKVLICYDNDSPGATGALKAQKYLPDAAVVIWPETTSKDVTEYQMKDGDLEKLFSNAWHFQMNEIEVGDTKKDKKIAIGIYRDRITIARDSRFGFYEKKLSTTFIDAYINYHVKLISDVQREIKKMSKPKFTGGGRSIETAKQVPIPNFIKFDGQGMAPCIFHNEKTASMHYIRKSNKVFCFGCNKVADVIEVVMKMDGITYSEALNKLV